MKNLLKISFIELTILLLVVTCRPANSSSEQTADNAPAKENPSLAQYQKAYFASGCFWCVEAIYESLEGVKEVVSGYSGGTVANPTYEMVGAHTTGHAEAVEVYYDPKVISYATLVKVFYASQDPTTVGQKPDFGDSYRSIIFYQNESEKQIAEAAKDSVAKLYSQPVVTEIVPLEKFWPAEKYHQNYEKLHPDQPYVRSVSIPRLNRFKEKHPELLKPE